MAVTALVADCEMQSGYYRDESKLERDENLRTLKPGLGLQPVRHTIVIGASAIFPDVICGDPGQSHQKKRRNYGDYKMYF